MLAVAELGDLDAPDQPLRSDRPIGGRHMVADKDEPTQARSAHVAMHHDVAIRADERPDLADPRAPFHGVDPNTNPLCEPGTH
jgi:hypothetical protein